MICPNCNSHVNDTYSFCPNCGAKIEKRIDPFEPTPPTPAPALTPAPTTQKKDNTIAIIGFVFAFISPVIGLICSIIGYSNAKTGGDYKNFAIAGIAISAVYIALSVIAVIIVVISFMLFIPILPYI